MSFSLVALAYYERGELQYVSRTNCRRLQCPVGRPNGHALNPPLPATAEALTRTSNYIAFHFPLQYVSNPSSPLPPHPHQISSKEREKGKIRTV